MTLQGIELQSLRINAQQEYLQRTRAFNGMTDALAQFVMTGKLDFKSLADSIISDLIRIQIQRIITLPLASAVSGLFASPTPAAPTSGSISVAHTGGVIGADALVQRELPRYHSGGTPAPHPIRSSCTPWSCVILRS